MDTVAGPRTRASRAAALHRRAAATASAAADVLDGIRPAPADHVRQYELADRLRSAAALLAPDWAGAALDTLTPSTPAGENPPPFVRVGTAAPLDDARFPALVPLIGTGNLAIDTDARDPRVAGLLRAVLLRLLAATPAGSLLVRAVDATGTALAPFATLADAGILPPPATDVAGLRAVLSEAEQWVTPGAGGRRRHDRVLLLVIAVLPEPTGRTDLARIEALAEQGRLNGLHLLVAGRPPACPPVPRAALLAIRTAYALLGDPPDASFAGPGRHPVDLPGGPHGAPPPGPPGSTADGPCSVDPPGGLNSPVFIEPDPPADLVETVCRRLADQVEAGSRLALADLLPDQCEPLWTASSVDGLSTTVGDASGRPVSLGFTELTPHWLVSGRSGAGRSTFLTTALLGLTARYGPSELVLYLADLGVGESFVEFLQTERDRSWIPQVRAAAMATDREYLLDLFDLLATEVRRREDAGARAGGQRFAELRQHRELPRIVCVVDNLPVLLTGRDRIATEAAARLDALARAGRSYGVHLLLAGEGDLGLGTRADRDSVLGQFPVRVALPGGGAVLEPTNDSAAGLPVGSAVVNTAGGLGGPRGAIRGHERTVRFPDPQDHPDVVESLRHRLWDARPLRSAPPVVFAGYARPALRNDPRYRAAVADGAPGPAALLGRALDVTRSTVTVPLGPSPGRNLAVLGPGPEAAGLLVTAARSVAAHHPPGAARFVVVAPENDFRRLAGALAAELAGRHPVEAVDRTGLLDALDATGPTYLVDFELDAGQLPPDRLRTLLREGPPAGRHLLGRWRTVAPFASLLEPEGEVAKLAAVAVVDVPGAQLATVFGRTVDWRPRAARAMLWDGPGEQGTVLVPFDEEGVPA
ncbi:FtsK/SpoIIIE domain-containing protein [Micromonospora sp. WMMA1363]|uniref:FtsK/SpoIIIE domain-containing protein n=1 Tax=Micromonospora sp. WMMA1363 TaxID=3053985 RepID=UPI00259CB2F2|nr:FtsK/SpoIIIE domain-containing protein [Micromonospora sp. WMMA1363]MDM4721278.1 FtsK/SpoIIIE domain-containing protein [Micromonospora sp. WMMA1363]